MSESALREQLIASLKQDFQFRAEVRGVHVISGEPVRADFLCYPSASLIARGFEKSWFVVETKHLDFARHDSKRLYETAWQAVTYRHSEFRVGNDLVRPSFAALYVTDTTPDHSNACEIAQRRRWDILTEFLLYANVGYFRVGRSDGWALYFGQARYFDSKVGISGVRRGLKEYIGSKSKLSDSV